MLRLTASLPLVVCCWLCLSHAQSATAQDATAQDATAQAAPQVQADPKAMLSAAGKEAYGLLQSNDTAGAIARLEAARTGGQLTLVDSSLLGTLYLESDQAQKAYDTLQPLTAESNDPALLYNAGRAALATGHPEEGIGWLERSVQMVPGSPAARTLGMMKAQQSQCMESLELLRPWLEGQPGDVEGRTIAAMCALELRRPRTAEVLLHNLPMNDPKIAILRAQLLIQKSDPLSALVILEPMVQSSPQEMRADVYRMTTEAYLNSGQAKEAVALLGQLEARGPRLTLLYAEALYRTGDLERALGELKPVADAAMEGKARHPLVANALSDYGRILVAAGRAEEAVSFLAKATELLPERVEGWKSYGEALNATGRRDEARQALQTFRELQQKESEERRAAETALKDPTGSVMTEARQDAVDGNYDAALRKLRQELVISTGDIRPRLLLVQVLMAANRLDEATVVAAETAQTFTSNPDAFYQLGAVHLASQREDAAEAEFRKALAIDGEHVAALNDLAVLLATRGRKDEAVVLARKLAELRPEDAKVQQLLAQISGTAGK